MGKRIARATAVSLLGLIALSVQQAQAASANECLSAPNGVSPSGQHWYYHLDRTKNRKCWYLRAIDSAQGTAVASDNRKTPAIDALKPPAHEPGRSADATVSEEPAQMRAAAPADTSQAYAVTSAQTVPPDLPLSADPNGLTVASEDNQPFTAGRADAPAQPAPQLSEGNRAGAASTEVQTQSAAGAAMDGQKKEPARPAIQSAEHAVASTPSRDSGAGTGIVIVAATVLAALAAFIFMAVRRRVPFEGTTNQSDILEGGRSRSIEGSPMLDQGQISFEQVATDPLVDTRMQELLRLLELPRSAPRVDGERAA